MSTASSLHEPGGVSGADPTDEPESRSGTDDLISAYPSHIPMGLPFPQQSRDRDDRPDSEYTL